MINQYPFNILKNKYERHEIPNTNAFANDIIFTRIFSSGKCSKIKYKKKLKNKFENLKAGIVRKFKIQL